MSDPDFTQPMTDKDTADNISIVPLPFTIVESSSESPGCEAAATLEEYNEDGDGWQSEKGCIFPQTLTLKLTDEAAVIVALEILSHESKIPSKVGIDLGIVSSNASSFEECDSIIHLGYIVFNESDGQTRELKAIPIGGKTANFVRFTCHGCHEGQHNAHKQVGISAIRVLGREAKDDASVGGRADIDDAPVTMVQVSATSSLPLKIKNDLEPKITASVDRLERLKKVSAAAEDFDMAAKIKQELGKVYALLIAFKESECQMKQAALDEDYVQASRLKAERDERRNDAKTALVEVEQQFAGKAVDIATANLSISTIKDQSFMSERSLHDKKEEQDNSYDTDEEEYSNASTGREVESNSNDNGSSSRSAGSTDHPLAGVDGAEDLPSPEDIKRDLSRDLVHKVESLFGSYRTKCYFSKNWSLREAALAKMTLMIPEICSAGSTIDADVAEVVFTIIESSNSDKNVQVMLSGLLLFDEALLQLERNGKAPNSMTPQLSRILVDLFSKMADNSKKVADSAEISLLALAHSSTVDVSYIALLATKRVRSKEAKGGRTVRARLQFLENLSAEFGVDVAWKRIIEFAKVCKAFDHRDGSVRDAAKSLVICNAKIHGNDVFKSLEGEIAERQLRDLEKFCHRI